MYLRRELWWLTGKQMPFYRTISQFRVDNKIGFRNLFTHYREFCLQLDLYGRERIAIDGPKFRAQNSKKQNFNEAKIKRHLEYINTKTEEYLSELDEQDRIEALSNPENSANWIVFLLRRWELAGVR